MNVHFTFSYHYANSSLLDIDTADDDPLLLEYPFELREAVLRLPLLVPISLLGSLITSAALDP
jgi:hypothetical protein